MSEPERLGARLKQAREAAGLSAAEVAGRMSVDVAVVQSWERGEETPRPNRLHILSGVLGVPFGTLFGVVDETPEPDDFLHRFQRLEQKFEEMSELQARLVRLSDELAGEIAELRKAEGRQAA